MLQERIRAHAKWVMQTLQEHPDIANIEQRTKGSLIEPLLQCIGYNPNDPGQVEREAVIRGKKVDYMLVGKRGAKIAVEAKPAKTQLSEKEVDQLDGYFHHSDAVAGILTNGMEFWLFTDLDKTNVMDSEPYRTINIQNLTDNDIHHLEALTRNQARQSAVHARAKEERYRRLVKRIVERELTSPSQEFMRLVGRKAGIKPLTKASVEMIRPYIDEAIGLSRGTTPSPPTQPPGPSPTGDPREPWPSVFPGYDPGNPRSEPRMKSVTLLGRPLLAKNYTHMLCLVVAVLQSQHPDDFGKRVRQEPFYKVTRTRQYISKAEEDFDPKYPEDRRLVGGHYVAVGLNAKAKVRRARQFLTAFGYDPAELVVHTSDD